VGRERRLTDHRHLDKALQSDMDAPLTTTPISSASILERGDRQHHHHLGAGHAATIAPITRGASGSTARVDVRPNWKERPVMPTKRDLQ
jgi:hypothetical protein